MTRSTRKVCMIGDFAVGKTSLVARYVHDAFSEKYLTTVGVKIDTKELRLPQGREVKLVIWDIAGTDAFSTLDHSYLRGAAGYLLIADGTRPETVEATQSLRRDLEAQLGPLPFVMLLNKRDRIADWCVSEETRAQLKEAGANVMLTSARTGENVEAAFAALANELLPGGAG